MLRLCEGIVRRALSEPSIGSITTRASAAGAELDLAALLGDGDEGGALRGQRLELGEDRVLAAAVDHQGVVAALADPLVDGAGLDCPRTCVEDRPLRRHGAAADPEPVCVESERWCRRSGASGRPRPCYGLATPAEQSERAGSVGRCRPSSRMD